MVTGKKRELVKLAMCVPVLLLRVATKSKGKKKKCGRSSEAFAFMETFSNYINNLLRHSRGALNSANLFHACSFSAIALQ